MLVIWTAAEPSAARRAFTEVFNSFHPKPDHRFHQWDDELYVARPGEVVLSCGTCPLRTLQQNGIIPKNRTITSTRGTVYRASLDTGDYLTTFDPGLIDKEPEKAADIQWDARLAHRYLVTGSLQPPLGKYQWVGDLSGFIASIEKRHKISGKPVDVSFDTETMGLFPWYPDKRIVAAGFCADAGAAVAIKCNERALNKSLYKSVQWLLNSPKVKLRGANLKYDLIWVAETWGIECTNFTMDTLLVGSLLNENRSNSLTSHAQLYSTIGSYDGAFNQKYDKGHMELVPDEDLLNYLGGDVDACMQAGNAMKGELLQDPELANFYARVLHPAARTFERIERHGVLVDEEKLRALGADLEAEIKKLTNEALIALPGRLKMKFLDKIEGQLQAGKSPFTPKILKEYFFGPLGLNLKPRVTTENTGEPSTARSHLRMFADTPEAKVMCELLEGINSASKTLSTYVHGFIKHLRPDGRIHPTYMLYHGALHDSGDSDDSGTTTGRLAAKDPAFQTVPKKTKWAKRLRECYPAPPGKVMVQIDFSQGELRVIACVAPEERMIETYRQGMDLHSITAASLAGYELEELLALEESNPALFNKLRTNGKAGNFGLCIAEGSLVLTDSGLRPIEQVTTEDRVWDGVEWVSHEGLIFKGVQEVITYDGVTATPDHVVYLEDGRSVPIREAASEVGRPRLAVGENEGKPVRFVGGDRGQDRAREQDIPPLRAVPLLGDGCGEVCAGGQPAEREDQGSEGKALQVRVRPEGQPAWGALRCDGPALHEPELRGVPAVRWPGDRAALHEPAALHHLDAGALAARELPQGADRPYRREWSLRTRQCSAGDTTGEPGEQADCGLGRLQGAEGVRSAPVASHEDGSSGDDHGATPGREAGSLGRVSGGDPAAGGPRQTARVYDLLNAGPRHRFTVSGRIVSNCYGMSAAGFVDYAWASYGLKLTLEEAEQMRHAFLFEQWTGLPVYHENMKVFVRKHQYVRSPLGRIRHLPTIRSRDGYTRSTAERQAINSPIQSSLSDLMLLALTLIERNLGDVVDIVGMIHDAGLFYVPEKDAASWAQRIVEVASNLPIAEYFDWHPPLDFPVDAEIGPNLAQLKKLKF